MTAWHIRLARAYIDAGFTDHEIAVFLHLTNGADVDAIAALRGPRSESEDRQNP